MDLHRPPAAVVLMAASAGGIRALSTVLAALPSTFPAPVVIVQHRPATGNSMLARVLSRASALPVEEARAGHVIKTGTVYLARPDLHLTLGKDGVFRYVDGNRVRHVLSSANPLFASSADAVGDRAIAVVLTGSGTDGTDGVRAIKARGGTVIAQDQPTSEFFGMPGAAIRSGAVDYVVPLQEVAPTLVRLVAMRQNLESALRN